MEACVETWVVWDRVEYMGHVETHNTQVEEHVRCAGHMWRRVECVGTSHPGMESYLTPSLCDTG